MRRQMAYGVAVRFTPGGHPIFAGRCGTCGWRGAEGELAAAEIEAAAHVEQANG